MFVYEEEEEEWADDDDAAGQARPGTTKRKQYYTKKVATAMLKSLPKSDQASYLYMISLHLTGPITEEQNTRGRLIYAPEDTKQTIGLLLDKPIPQMPSFPVYTRSGEVTASVDLLSSDLVLSEAEISRLLKFHHFVFSGVLHLEKDPMEFNPEQAEFGCVVVPLNGEENVQIDWEFVDKVIQFMPSQKRADTLKRRRVPGTSRVCNKSGGDDNENGGKFEFCMEDFEDAVVMPSYRNMDQPQHFYVAEIRTDLNPLSSFPSPELYKTFQDYYTTKYGLEITCKDQPLLDVDHTSARLNLLTPRYMNPKGMALPTSSAETKRARRENLQQKQILVPELCDVHIFPASLWRKAVCLPAILYRTNCLLLAEELRQRVACQTGIGQEELPPGFRFPQLDFGFETSPEKLMEAESSSSASNKSNYSSKASTKSSESPAASLAKRQQELELSESSSYPLSERIGNPEVSSKLAGEGTGSKDSSPSDLVPEISMDNNLDKADSAASSDTDSGIMSSGSDTYLGPAQCAQSVAAASREDLSRNRSLNVEVQSTDQEKYLEKQCNVHIESYPVIVSSPSTLLGKPSTSCSSKSSFITEITSTAENGDLTAGANHVSHVSHPIDVATTFCASQAAATDKITTYPGDDCSPSKPLIENLSQPSTAETFVTCPNSTIECKYREPQVPTVPCQPLSPSAHPPSISLRSEPPTLCSATPGESSSLRPGCDPCVTTSSPSPEQPPPPPPDSSQSRSSSHHSGEPSHHSKEQNHHSHVHPAIPDVGPAATPVDANIITDTLQSVEKNPHSEPSGKEKSMPCTVSTTSHNSSPSNLESCTQDAQTNPTARSKPLSPPCHPPEAAIIMNTLGQELGDLDIDLICPGTLHNIRHSTFQARGGEKSGEECSKTKSTSSGKNHLNGWNVSFDGQNSPVTDADIIKFSFNADSPKKSEEEVKIGTWGEDEKSKRKCKTAREKQTSAQGSKKSKERSAKEAVDTTENDRISSDPIEEKGAVVVAAISSMQPPEPAGSAGIASLEQPHAKDFDIGVWNVRNSQQLPSQGADSSTSTQEYLYRNSDGKASSPTLLCGHISLDEDRDFSSFPGPSPCLLLQALTMSNANDFFSLERLETIGDSFLKYAITVYLYCCYPGIHEGKLSYLRSKQVSNYNLYRLGRRKSLAERMVATKFEPYENWLPPGFVINEDRRRGPVPKVVVVPPSPREETRMGPTSRGNVSQQNWPEDSGGGQEDEAGLFRAELDWLQHSQEQDQREEAGAGTGGGSSSSAGAGGSGLIPYSLQQHHGLPDKSLADCVEALIGCYLTTCGRKAALLFMSWLGLRVLPKRTGNTRANDDDSPPWKVSEQQFAELRCPPSPMFFPTEANQARLEQLLEGFAGLEDTIQYKFRDRSYLLQAFTHASYHYNTITDCYQRIEFLGDAILDYVITRHLYEDSQKHSPGILTDLRSALVNNNIFAALAVKWGFHKYFKAVSPALFQVIDTFVKFQEGKDQDHIDIDEEYQEVSMEEPISEEAADDDDEEDEEEVEMEIPKALGDIFESVAGAIYLDSGMSLDAVWTVYYRMMKPHIDKYLKSIPKSPVRELLETEPETAKFERPQRTVNGKVRVTVNVVGKGEFSGVGRNYRIAKSAAAKRALRSIRFMAENLA
ncbi:endoribonuclease dicer [Plakobranchus ocellatus]|uniref:ribonuclease III n=1 Tax=Plakobranchus ocellatus TaxID=259542 RepID=A0AAV4DCB1_9GAST|nr:endoribonuclease dicer [Plakobranchus ocellatus]